MIKQRSFTYSIRFDRIEKSADVNDLQLEDFVRVFISRQDGLCVFDATGLTPITGQRFFGKLSSVGLTRLELHITHQSHQAAQPFDRQWPFIGNIDEGIWLKADCVPRAVVI